MELLARKIYRPRGYTHTRFIDVGGYKYNFEGFCENFIYPMSIN